MRTTRGPHEIKRSLITFQSVITAAESAQRGYLLTGQTGYLEPYHVAMRSWRKQIERLRELTVDDPNASRGHHDAGGTDDRRGQPPGADDSAAVRSPGRTATPTSRARIARRRRWTACAASSIA